MQMSFIGRSFFWASLTVALLPGSADAGDAIRQLTILSRPQAVQPQEFQSIQLMAQEWKKLGVDVDIKVQPWEQMSDFVWAERDKWDMTGWQMAGRPERSDPDELLYNLFHSSTAKDGYNFVGYLNPDYDKLATEQRQETDPEKRKALVFAAQEMLARDQPIINLVHPRLTYAFNKDIWDEASVVDQAGVGIKNFWTFTSIKPLGAQKDIIVNAGDAVTFINPLYISGPVDSWITELVWDRLLRVGPDGLPKAWAAESFTWVDATTVDVTLRPGLKWHDGSPVTQDDVIFSFLTPQSDKAPMYKPFVSNIASIDKQGDNGLRFKLKAPSAAFLTTTLSKVNLIPKAIWEPKIKALEGKADTAETIQEDVPMGSGPFKFVRWTKNEEVVLEANPDHFAAPKAARWILRTVSNTEAALGMLKSGEINFLSEYTGDPEVLEDLLAGMPALKMVVTDDLGFRYIGLNERRAPFDDPAFRRALSAAIDRRLIIGAAYKGYATPANSVIAPVLTFWHDPAVDKMETGIDVAKKILEDAGYSIIDGKLHYPDGKTDTAQ
jgi:peptide/nickel transport system substrate-binding protein